MNVATRLHSSPLLPSKPDVQVLFAACGGEREEKRGGNSLDRDTIRLCDVPHTPSGATPLDSA